MYNPKIVTALKKMIIPILVAISSQPLLTTLKNDTPHPYNSKTFLVKSYVVQKKVEILLNPCKQVLYQCHMVE